MQECNVEWDVGSDVGYGMRWRSVLLLEWSWSYDVVHFDGDLKVQRQDGEVDERLGLPQSFCEVLL